MVTGYPKEYLDKYEVITETYRERDDPEAKQKRDRRARELRKQGYTVKVETYSFSDLGTGAGYFLTAERPRKTCVITSTGKVACGTPVSADKICSECGRTTPKLGYRGMCNVCSNTHFREGG